jgi:hypothetical protein
MRLLGGRHREKHQRPGNRIEVSDEDGKRLKRIGYLGDDVAFSTYVEILQPGGSFEETLPISTLFDMHQPGTYTIHVELAGVEPSESVRSNDLRITVDDSQGSSCASGN